MSHGSKTILHNVDESRPSSRPSSRPPPDVERGTSHSDSTFVWFHGFFFVLQVLQPNPTTETISQIMKKYWAKLCEFRTAKSYTECKPKLESTGLALEHTGATGWLVLLDC